MPPAYLGEIRMFAGNFAPVDWELCDGRSLSIRGNESLFSLLGVRWGGDGSSNFNLPDLRGRVPIGQGAAPRLTPRSIATLGGQETVQVKTAEMPAHFHSLNAVQDAATSNAAADDLLLASPDSTGSETVGRMYVKVPPEPDNPRQLDARTVTPVGGGLPHENMMPSFAVSFIICVAGLYPPNAQ